MSDITKNITGSIISALLIALIISLWNDYLYKRDRLTGYWKVEFETTESSYSKYIGLKTYFDFVINQEGNRLVGSGEKISEDSVNGVIEYESAKRVHIELTGAVRYRVFSKNTVDIRYVEEGRKRQSSTIVKLRIESPESMVGSYISTIAGSRGIAKFTKVNGI